MEQNKFNFDEIIDRKGTNSLKWDSFDSKSYPDILPMWVADMDFKTDPAIIEKMQEIVSRGIFGYNIVPDEWYNAIIKHWETAHLTSIKKEWLIFCNGVVPAITSAIKRLSNVGDNVVTLTPTYDIFFHSIENTGRHVVECPLKCNDEVGYYYLDYELLEKQLQDPNTRILLISNPHNPTGKKFDKREMTYIETSCRNNNVILISDEIHCDISMYDYISALKNPYSCKMVVCLSASKAFNLAGLQSAAVVIPDKNINDIVNRGLNSDELAEPNSFAIASTIAAFEKESVWLSELNKYIDTNKNFAIDYMKENCPELKIATSSFGSTYLLWINCGYPIAIPFSDYLLKYKGLAVCPGTQYRGTNANNFIRINIACPMERLKEGLDRLVEGYYEFIEDFANC